MISTDALQVGFLSSLTTVNDTTIFIKTIVLKNDRFVMKTAKKNRKQTIAFKNDRFFKTVVFQKDRFYKNRCVVNGR